MGKVIIIAGIPALGKTLAAKQWAMSSVGNVQVNVDDLDSGDFKQSKYGDGPIPKYWVDEYVAFIGDYAVQGLIKEDKMVTILFVSTHENVLEKLASAYRHVAYFGIAIPKYPTTYDDDGSLLVDTTQYMTHLENRMESNPDNEGFRRAFEYMDKDANSVYSVMTLEDRLDKLRDMYGTTFKTINILCTLVESDKNVVESEKFEMPGTYVGLSKMLHDPHGTFTYTANITCPFLSDAIEPLAMIPYKLNM